MPVYTDEESPSPRPNANREQSDPSVVDNNNKSIPDVGDGDDASSDTIGAPIVPRRGSLIVDGQSNIISYSYGNDDNSFEHKMDENSDNSFRWREPLFLLPKFELNPNKLLREKHGKLYFPKNKNSIRYKGQVGQKLNDFDKDGWVYFAVNSVCI